MAKQKYEMKTERSKGMDTKHMLQLADMRLAPYMQLATGLIGKERHAGGNMFRHQMDTLAILIDYGLLFPRDDEPGIDYLVPSLSYIKENNQPTKHYSWIFTCITMLAFIAMNVLFAMLSFTELNE